MEILSVENLTFTYPQSKTAAVSDVSFSLQHGEFAVLCGSTGCGKSTLLRLLKPELSPLGDCTGRIFFSGTEKDAMRPEISAAKIGFVMQKPEQQIVTDKVWHELAFGLENLHIPQNIIARRIAEMASYFGISDWFDRDTAALSGGQKQLLNLAAIMVMQPDLLILDEPTAQLDPIAAADFIMTLRRLCTDFSMTILLAEHRLEEVIPLCDRLLVMEDGGLLHDDAPRRIIPKLREKPQIACAMPAAARICHALEESGECPLTVREGRTYLERHFDNAIRSLQAPDPPAQTEPALEFREVHFRYARSLPDVLQGLDLKIFRQEIFCILGGNGSGKSTALSAAAGIYKPYIGKIHIFGKKNGGRLSMLPQDVQTVFLKNSVREELADAGTDGRDLPFSLDHLLDMHPYDLSGGQQQLLALAKVLAQKPEILLLDEPTKGLDAHTKQQFVRILRTLQADGMTIVIVTHDAELAAECADRCALFFRGNVVSVDTPENFFAENHFYTTAASRMTRGFFDHAVTVEQAAALCRMNERRDAGDPQ